MLRQEMLQKLAEPHEGPCVSIYSPTHDSGTEAEGDPIWLKTGLQKAEKILKEREVEAGRIKSILAPAWDFQRRLGPNDFGAGTLCCLVAENFEEIVHTPRQMQNERVIVGDRFHLKPLIPTLTENAHFYVLAISRHDVRLLQCTRYTQKEEPLSRHQVPRHIREVIGEVEPKQSLQYHSSARGAGRGDHQAMYHGHGKEQRMEEHQILHYFRDVNEGIVKYLNGHSPLIFAGVEELFHPYKLANSYEHLLDEPIRGNPEHLRPEELRERAWEIIEPHLQERIAHGQEAFAEALAHNRAVDDMAAVVLAARDGRVAHFFGTLDEESWGRVPEVGDEVQIHSSSQGDDYDLIDYAAVETMHKGGDAFLVEREQVPGGGRAAAILRY